MSGRSEIGDELIAFLPNMRRYAMSLSRSADVADDLVQQACERALAGSAGFDPGTRFEAWIFRIIRNLWIDRARRLKTAGPVEDIDDRFDLAGGDGSDLVESRSELAHVSRALDQIPHEQREVLLLVCVEDLSYKETADALGVPIGTVMSRLARGRKKLAEVSGITFPVTRSSGARD